MSAFIASHPLTFAALTVGVVVGAAVAGAFGMLWYCFKDGIGFR